MNYEDMSREELKAEAVRQGVNLVAMGGKTSNEEIIAAILALPTKTPAPQSLGEPVSDEDAANMEAAELASRPDYASMSKAELVAEAQGRSIDTSALKTKAKLIDALLAADGVSEDEQAEMDEGEDQG